MSTTEKQWKVVVDLLQCITAGKFKTQAASDALVKIVNLLEPMARQPAAPTTTWTKLVVGLKVGSSHCDSCCCNKLVPWRQSYCAPAVNPIEDQPAFFGPLVATNIQTK